MPESKKAFLSDMSGSEPVGRLLRRRFWLFLLATAAGVISAALIPMLPSELTPVYVVAMVLITITLVGAIVVSIVRLVIKS